MHSLLGLLTFLGICSARPTQFEPGHLQLSSPSPGFSSQYLPTAARPSVASNDSDNPASNVTLPLHPDNIPWLHSKISYDFHRFTPPNGGHLVMSISTSIYYSWVDLTNAPIIVDITVRKIPFPNFLYTISPSLLLQNTFTPLKIGIACCWILEDVFKLAVWPGYIRAELSENNRRKFGTVEIANSPEAAAASSTAPEDKQLEKTLFANKTYSTIARSGQNANGQKTALAVPEDMEKRWFTCLSKFLFYIVTKMPQGNVASDMPPSPFGRNTKTYRLKCVPGEVSNKDQIDVTIYPITRQDQYRLTWDALAKTLLVFGTRVAEVEDTWDTEQVVIHADNVVTAALGIRVDKGNRAIATA